MAEILKGIDVVKGMKKRAEALLGDLTAKGIKPVLCIVRVGERAEDIAYEKSAIKRCADFGILARRGKSLQWWTLIISMSYPAFGVLSTSTVYPSVSA